MFSPLCGPARRAQLFSFALAACLALTAGRARAQSSVVEIVEAAAPAVVNVSVLFESAKRTVHQGRIVDAVRIERPGSGIVLSSTGLVVTNAHLVAETVEEDGSPSEEFWILVSTRGGGSFPATVVAVDERLDLALLQVNAGALKLSALPLASLENRRAGERVIAMSLAGTRAHDIFAGVLAFPGGPVRLREALLEPSEVLLTDARFHRSLDGGPLLDSLGRLLGVHNSSHVSVRPEGFEEEDEDADPEPDTDYAVIVSSQAIRTAFDKWLPEELVPVAPLQTEPVQEAVAPIATIAPSVVSVWTGEPDEHPALPDPADPAARLLPETLGSGVVIDPRGLVLTYGGLFAEGAESASVRVATGEVYRAKLLVRKSVRKLALLALELPEGITLEAATLADSRQALAGELVAVVGRPYSGITLSVGVLSSLEREKFVQVASWVHPGHYGGALVDRNGRLIGIATSQPASAGRVEEKSYLGFAAPLHVALETFSEELEGYGELPVVHDDEAAVEARRSVAVRVVERTRHSMVNVLVSLAKEEESTGFDPFAEVEKSFHLLGMGSGVVVDASGLAITNWHVVDAAMNDDGSQSEDSLVEVTMPGGARYTADVLSTSRDDDLALISLRLGPDETLEPVVLGDSEALQVGEPVFAIGNPLGLANSVSAGVVSCKNMDVRIRGRLRKYENMLQTDAAINPGNSGGALLDSQGRLVGINSAGRTGAGMAIPVSRARAVFSDTLTSVEKLHSAYLGFQVEESDAGLVVRSVDRGGPAEHASLEVGDALLAFAGAEFQSAVQFARAQLSVRAGERVSLRIARYGEEHELFLVPMSYTAWRIEQQSGLELVALDYDEETELVRDASVALHRAYVGDDVAMPRVFMSGALRVEDVRSLEGDKQNPVLAGDLLLGMNRRLRSTAGDSYQLTRFESLADVRAAFDPLATKDGTRSELWLLRNGRIETVRVLLRRPPR